MGPLKLPGGIDMDIDNEYISDTNFIANYYNEYHNKHNLNFIKEKEVIDIIEHNNNYKLIINDNTYYLCKINILCMYIYNNYNLLNNNKDYNFCKYNLNTFDIQNKKIVIVGSGASSIDYIINLLPKNKLIYWIIRGDSYFDIRDYQHINVNFDKILKKFKENLIIYYNSIIININDNNSIIISNNIEISNIDHCVFLTGYHSKSKLIEKIGLECIDDKYIKLNENYETTTKNIYCAGSICTQKNRKVYIHNGNNDILAKIISDINSKLKN